MDGVPDAPWVSRSMSPLGHARAFITTMVTNYVNTKLFLHVDSILALTIPRNVKHPRKQLAVLRAPVDRQSSYPATRLPKPANYTQVGAIAAK